jgi:hypothetical protein
MAHDLLTTERMLTDRNERTMGTNRPMLLETLFKTNLFFFNSNEIAHIDFCQHLVLTHNKPNKSRKTTTM